MGHRDRDLLPPISADVGLTMAQAIAVIGGGINGLVAAAELAHAGRQVVLIERSERIGGFIAAGERTLPGYVHDVYSSWHPLFVSSPAYAMFSDHLAARGLEYLNTGGPVCASTSLAAGERRTVIAHRDPAATAEGLVSARDGEAYLRMLEDFERRAPTVFGALGGEIGSARSLAVLAGRAVRTLGPQGAKLLAWDGLSSGRAFLRRHFEGWAVDALWIPWLLHAGLGPDHATGGILIPVFAATIHQFGLPVVRGGVGSFLSAFEGLLHDVGVEIRTGTEAEEILLEKGRAVGVRTSSGTIPADTVLASVSPQALYGGLLAPSGAVAAQRSMATRYRPGRGAIQIHLALNGPIPWEEPVLRTVPLVHLSSGSPSTGVAVAQAEAGLLPSAPTVVVGQQSLLDYSRAPAGKATLWLQLQEAPFAPTGDAGGTIDTSRGWDDRSLRDRYLERVLDQLEQFAPGARSTVLASDFIAPTDLLQANPNAIGGDPYAGAAELDQNLMWRPFPGAAAHRTPARGVWHIGAATHPGPGLGAGSGHIVAQRILAQPASRR